MKFSAYTLKPVPVTDAMTEVLGTRPLEAYLGRDLLCVYNDEEIVREMTPYMDKIKELEGLLAHVTAPGHDFDAVSRSFIPKLKVNEDPACGSGYCHIVPYWAHKLGKETIIAYQVSSREGALYCRMEGNKAFISENPHSFQNVYYTFKLINHNES